MVEISCERGHRSATVAQIVDRAGVSRRTFYQLFEDRSDCFLAAFEQAVTRAAPKVTAASEVEHSWVDRVRAGLLALLVFFDEEPELAWICVVEALAAGPATLARRGELLERLAAVVEDGRDLIRPDLSPLTAEGLVGGAFAVIHARLLQTNPGPLSALLSPLMGMIALPYVGGPPARRELARRPPRVPAPQQDDGDPLADLEIRLTYRTVRVLAAIAEDPGLCNRDVADGAGISDEGQISKLLARLNRHGFIENSGEGQPRGEPNAWTLTPKGQKVQDAVPVWPARVGA